MSKATPEELADNAKKPGVFNIVEVLNERSYPLDDVYVYLDEHAAYMASKIDNEIDELSKESLILNDDELDKKIIEKKKERQSLIEELTSSKYVFRITGISEGRRSEIMDKAEKEFPIEYIEDKNVFSGELKRIEVENSDRDRLFTNLLWEACILSITSPSGDIQEGISLSDVIKLREALPVASSAQINQAIEKLRSSTAMFMFKVDEDFLAKS